MFSYSPTAADTLTVLKGIAAAITDEKFTASVDETNEFLNIEAADIASNNVLILSENLTTETVTSIITFGTEENGDILIPGGVITNIVNADAGLLAVENLCGYIAGRDEETDVEFRQSYADKIFNRSSNMLESIRSAILLNVQGVRSVAPYENATHQWYVDGTYEYERQVHQGVHREYHATGRRQAAGVDRVLGLLYGTGQHPFPPVQPWRVA